MLGYRPLIERAAFTTPPTSAVTSASAETPRGPRWSITAISPGATRWTNRLVLGSTRARLPQRLRPPSGRRSRPRLLPERWTPPWSFDLSA